MSKGVAMGWLGRESDRSLASMFFRRGKAIEYVRPGNIFRRVHEDNLLETAEIVSVGTDAYGIPHVRFNVTFSRPNRFSYDEGSRMLALRSFAERYRERVSV
jgi:hypothetical protein